jgi:predicted MFS family arabinose efflux permease
VLFDLLMRTITPRSTVTLTSVETSIQNLASIIAPLLGGVIADRFGLAVGLGVAGAVTLAGALMFIIAGPPRSVPVPHAAADPPPTLDAQPDAQPEGA